MISIGSIPSRISGRIVPQEQKYMAPLWQPLEYIDSDAGNSSFNHFNHCHRYAAKLLGLRAGSASTGACKQFAAIHNSRLVNMPKDQHLYAQSIRHSLGCLFIKSIFAQPISFPEVLADRLLAASLQCLPQHIYFDRLAHVAIHACSQTHFAIAL